MTTKIPVELSSTPGIVDGSNATAITIDSSERVGIGTTSPSSYYSKELVVAVSDNGGITLVNSDTSHAAYLMFADGTSGADVYRGQIGYDHNNNSMFFSTDSTLRLMINSSGNVGIGTSSPTSLLHVNGDAYANRIIGRAFIESSSGFISDTILSFSSFIFFYC